MTETSSLLTALPFGAPLTGHTSTVLSVAAVPMPDGRVLLASASDDMTVRLWDPVTGTAIGAPLTGHTSWVPSVAAVPMPDGQVLLASASHDMTVRLWDPVTGTAIGAPLTGHTSTVRSVAAVPMPDGQVLLASAGDRTVRLWDPVTGTAIGAPLTGHTDTVLSVAAVSMPDGRVLLASASADGTVRMWEVVREERVQQVPGYVSDTAADRDLLDRDREAVAIADLLTARSARPPLAVGVFGQWGEGKTQFLDLVYRAVAARSAAAASEVAAGRKDPIAHAHVRQVQFNAWHYAETDLWASLVSELFTQLGADQDPAVQARQRSRLTAEVIKTRRLREQLTGARQRLTALEQARAGRVTPRTAAAVLKCLPWWSWAPAAAAATIGFIALVGTGLDWWSGLQQWMLALPWIATAAALLPGLRSAWAASKDTRQRIREGWELVHNAPERARQHLEGAIAVAAAEVERLERAVQDLTAAGQLAGLVQDRATVGDYRQRLGLMTQIRQDFKAMADLLHAASTMTLNDNADPGRLHGLDPGQRKAGRRRRSGNHPMRPAEQGVDLAGDRLPAIDRIVLYVDDLDRCPPQRVVEVLEAVHLLLAGELFVVVVALDPRWLLRSISSHYRDLFAADFANPPQGQDEAAHQELGFNHGPAQYLEKIFQIVLTLPPLDQRGYHNLIDTLVGIRADQQVEPTLGEATAPFPQPGPENLAAAKEQTAPAITSPGPDARTAPAGTTNESLQHQGLRTVRRIDPLALTADELLLMAQLGPPLITAPRAVKRLTNSYGVLAACQPRAPDGDRVELDPIPDVLADDQELPDENPSPAKPVAYPYRAGMVLLAAVIGYPDLGPQLFIALHHAGQSTPGRAWSHWLRDHSPGERPDLSRPQQGQQQSRLHDLVEALTHVSHQATAAGLPLPQRLDTWAAWVIPVGRLSFPTGPAVTRLMSRPPDNSG